MASPVDPPPGTSPRRSSRQWPCAALAGCAALALLAAAPGMPARAGRPPAAAAAVTAEARLAEQRPKRIVSLNLCTDQLLMQLVSPTRIAAVTYLARDPLYSSMASQARHLPMTRGTAEEVIALDPDLVLAGPFSTRETVAILERLGYRVVSIDAADSFPDIIAALRALAAVVGEQERGEELVRAIEARLAALPGPAPGARRPVFVDYGANGYVSGEGALITAVANAAGFDTLGQRLGISGGRAVSLEQLLVAHPDLVALGDGYSGPALATEAFRHPALARLLADSAEVAMPPAATSCGSLRTLEALDALVAARRELR